MGAPSWSRTFADPAPFAFTVNQASQNCGNCQQGRLAGWVGKGQGAWLVVTGCRSVSNLAWKAHLTLSSFSLKNRQRWAIQIAMHRERQRRKQAWERAAEGQRLWNWSREPFLSHRAFEWSAGRKASSAEQWSVPALPASQAEAAATAAATATLSRAAAAPPAAASCCRPHLALALKTQPAPAATRWHPGARPHRWVNHGRLLLHRALQKVVEREVGIVVGHALLGLRHPQLPHAGLAVEPRGGRRLGGALQHGAAL